MVKKAKAPKNPVKRFKPFPFLQLPPELRNRIYEFCVLPQDGPFNLGISTRRDCHLARHEGIKGYQLNIMALCKQVHEECASLLYGHEMHFTNCHCVQVFISQIGPTNQSLLRHLSLNCERGSESNRDLFFLWSGLALAPYTEILEVDCFLFGRGAYLYDNPAKAACKFFANAKVWFDSIVRASGFAQAPLEILHVHPKIFRSRYPGGRFIDTKIIDCRNVCTYLTLEESERIMSEEADARANIFFATLSSLLKARFPRHRQKPDDRDDGQ